MKISIIVPMYNVEKYLVKCVKSIINQSYKNIEIILVDDGSTDKSGKIAEDLKVSDDRIKVYHKNNGGLSDARNYGIDRATGDFILFVDSDDYINITMIEELAKIIKKTNADIICFNLLSVKEDETLANNNAYCIGDTKKYFTMIYKDALIDNIYRKHIRYEAPSKIYKKYILDEIKFTKGIYAEDFDSFYKFLKVAKKIVYYDSNLYYYVQRKGSIMHEKSQKFYADEYNIEKKFYREVNSIIEYKRDFCWNSTRYFKKMSRIYSYITNQNLQKEIKKDIKDIGINNICLKYKILYLFFTINSNLYKKLFVKFYKR